MKIQKKKSKLKKLTFFKVKYGFIFIIIKVNINFLTFVTINESIKKKCQ